MKFLIELSKQVSQVKSELDSMDAGCGDGDFGSTMTRAFEQSTKALEQAQRDDVGAILISAGAAILSSAGGTAGPIFGALFMEAGKLAKGKREVELQDLASMFDSSNRKIRFVGRAAVGDKTMIDALEPAVNSLKESARAGTSLQTALDRASEASKIGCESTKQMIAKYGRAKYLGEQTIGFVDPGAYLTSLVFETLADTAKRT
jgi:dihydroxyacetone kinase-like protein